MVGNLCAWIYIDILATKKSWKVNGDCDIPSTKVMDYLFPHHDKYAKDSTQHLVNFHQKVNQNSSWRFAIHHHRSCFSWHDRSGHLLMLGCRDWVDSQYNHFGKWYPMCFCCVKNCGKEFNLINAVSPCQCFSGVLISFKRGTTTCYCCLVQNTEEQDENHSLEKNFNQLPVSKKPSLDFEAQAC